MIQVITYQLAIDGKTWIKSAVIEYFTRPAYVDRRGYILPDRVYSEALDKTYAKLDIVESEWWSTPWWKRLVKKRPLFMDVWREFDPRKAQQCNIDNRPHNRLRTS